MLVGQLAHMYFYPVILKNVLCRYLPTLPPTLRFVTPLTTTASDSRTRETAVFRGSPRRPSAGRLGRAARLLQKHLAPEYDVQSFHIGSQKIGEQALFIGAEQSGVRFLPWAGRALRFAVIFAVLAIIRKIAKTEMWTLRSS